MTNNTNTSTPWYLSRTFWLNTAALVSLLFPAVREWLESNPIEFSAALGAANVLLKFVTLGKHQISPSSSATGSTVSDVGETTAGAEDNSSHLEDRAEDPHREASSMNGSGSSTLLLLIGGLLCLMVGSCSTEGTAQTVPTSVSLKPDRVVVTRGNTAFVGNLDTGIFYWEQRSPETTEAPVVVQTKGK